MDNREIVICGAGIAGISAAYFLSCIYKVRKITIIDYRPPLSLTSSQSTECYRNWWPEQDSSMVSLMNRSISIMGNIALQTNNVFHMNRRGYTYFTSSSDTLRKMDITAKRCEEFGAGKIKYITSINDLTKHHTSNVDRLDDTSFGAELITNKLVLQEKYPYINHEIIAALHVRKAGWLSAHQMGQYLLQSAKENGVEIIQKKIVNVEKSKNSFVISLENQIPITTSKLLIAAGPYINDVCNHLNVALPVYNELHLKVAFNDHLQLVPRAAPLLILADSQFLKWSEEESSMISEDASLHWMLDELPAGIHVRPEGGLHSNTILILWDYKTRKMSPVFPVPVDPILPDILLRGLSQLIPEMVKYKQHYIRPQIDGGYYTRTADNRPLIGELDIEGAYMIGALSGFGIMAACAAGELVANYITGSNLPPYYVSFSINRFQTSGYLESLQDLDFNSQL